MGTSMRNQLDGIREQVRTDGRQVMDAVRERLGA